MFNALIDRQNRKMTGARQTSMIEHPCELSQDLRPPIRSNQRTIDEVGARQMKHLFRNRSAFMGKKRFGFVSEDSLDVLDHFASCVAATLGRFLGDHNSMRVKFGGQRAASR